MNALLKIKPVTSSEVTTRDICTALICDLGGSASDMPRNPEGDCAYSRDWEWFDPFKVTSMEEYLELPEHWQSIFRNANAECYNCGYRYVHAPTKLLGQFPRVPLKGVFVVVSDSATPETVIASDLIHTGGQFVEYDAKDKGIWIQRIKSNKEDLQEV